MSSLIKVLWYIERDLSDITLESLALKCDLSPEHITRMFVLNFGISLMRYVRARRLSEAAKRLIYEPNSILNIALDSGYGSHEAFSRAFHDLFAQTPQSVRASKTYDKLRLTEPNHMPNTPLSNPTPRMARREAFGLMGKFETYKFPNLSGIASQWQGLRQDYPEIYDRAQASFFAVNIMKPGSDELLYGACVLSTEIEARAQGLTRFDYPASDYLVFVHNGHISSIGALWGAIYGDWQDDWGKPSDKAPPFEHYDDRFDRKLGVGMVEIWVPIQP